MKRRLRNFKVPCLGPVEKGYNRRYHQAKHRAKIAEKGYRGLYKEVPDAIRQEILDKISEMIESYEEAISSGQIKRLPPETPPEQNDSKD